MNTPSFFNIKSRIGLVNLPIHQKELNIGVENGPEAVLSEKFLENYPGSTVHTFEFPMPEDIDPSDTYRIIAETTAQCRDFINQSIHPNENQVVVGGDHSVTFPSVIALLARIDPRKIGYIQFDSHGDILLEHESTTKNFHGMYIRALVDRFDIPVIDVLVPRKIPTGNLLYIGNLDLELPEQQFFTKNDIKTISKKDLEENQKESHVYFLEFVARFEHIHISFDVDGLDQSIAPATGIPAADGLKMENIADMLSLLSTHPSFSLDVVEVNPEKNGAEQTIKIAQELIEKILSY